MFVDLYTDAGGSDDRIYPALYFCDAIFARNPGGLGMEAHDSDSRKQQAMDYPDLIGRVLLAVFLLFVNHIADAGDYLEPKRFNQWEFGTKLAEFFEDSNVDTVEEAVAKQEISKFLFKSLDIVPTRGKVTSLDMQCRDYPCTIDKVTISQTLEGEGLHVLAQYYRLADYTPFGRVETQGAIYLFCAAGRRGANLEKLAENLSLCGGIVPFESRKNPQPGPTPAGTETTEDLILAVLIQRHGQPVAYVPRTHVTITQDGKEVPSYAQPDDPKRFHRYRWCPKQNGRQLYPRCDATITLTFDPFSGEGTVLYATRPVYAFAEARHSVIDENDWYYVTLSDSDKLYYNEQKPVQHCTGSHICDLKGIHITAEDLNKMQSKSE